MDILSDVPYDTARKINPVVEAEWAARLPVLAGLDYAILERIF